MYRHNEDEIKLAGEAMLTLHLGEALTGDGWRRDVRVTLADGLIAAIEHGAPAQPGDERHAVGVAGIANLHSHVFQRAMSGLAERRGASADNFWSWREAMYRFALSMTPDEVEAVAAEAYAEMLEAGFTRVGEFHYLHHAPDGRPYADFAEMSARIAAAAAESRIGLTLLPVFYAHADFGGAPPQEAQRRFICDIDGYARLLDAVRRAASSLDGANVGVAPHSLRAATPDELVRVCALAPNGPLHIHIAEQVSEVEACVAWFGARPVEWLLDHVAVDRRWCLIHATHMTPDETRRLAGSGAVAGLCPITEANLGDGLFSLVDFLAAGGRWGVGSDSNVQIGAAEELRLLEYGQRLTRQARNVTTAPGASTGRSLFEAARRGGDQALGRTTSGLIAGATADIVVLDPDHPGLLARRGDGWLDGWIFAGDRSVVRDVWAGGRKLVEHGRHIRRDALRSRYEAALRDVLSGA
jgi:formiminoglutamate deiminase